MKLKCFCLFLTLTSINIAAQVPQGFNYQAVATDGSNNPLSNLSINIRISLQSSESGGTIFWQELHNGILTSNKGLFSLIIGNGIRQPISQSLLFNDLNWRISPVYIKTEIDNGSGFINLGAAKLWTVPYSLLSEDVIGPVERLTIKNNDSYEQSILDEPLFEVKNRAGVSVFAVYNEGIRAVVGNPSKGVKGGFTVSGFVGAKGLPQNLMNITSDSIRFNVNNIPNKGAKGGFAVGGFNYAKQGNINQDFMYLTPEVSGNGQYNTFLGYQSGYLNSTGNSNAFIGYSAGYSNQTGSNNVYVGNLSGYASPFANYNVALGDSAGYGNTANYNVFIGKGTGKVNAGEYSTFIGYQAGLKNTSGPHNVFVGFMSGHTNTIGGMNVFIGDQAGKNNNDGWSNIFIGGAAGLSNSSGSNNILIGDIAGRNLKSGRYNILIGDMCGKANIVGNNNVFIGAMAGQNNTGSNNVFIGYNAGMNEITGSDKLYIDNSNTSFPLIGGDFTADRVGINRVPTTYTFEVGGTIWANGTAIVAGSTTWSDSRYKTDIAPLNNALANVLKMNGVRYNWKQTEFPQLNFPSGEQIGLIAQELEKIIPGLVYTGPDGYKSIFYEKLTPVLIEAIKDQQQQIESYKSQLQLLQQQVNRIEALLTNKITE